MQKTPIKNEIEKEYKIRTETSRMPPDEKAIAFDPLNKKIYRYRTCKNKTSIIRNRGGKEITNGVNPYLKKR